jgi:hypothetical protein
VVAMVLKAGLVEGEEYDDSQLWEIVSLKNTNEWLQTPTVNQE